MPLAQFAGEIVEHEVSWRIDVADELLHQGVVVVGELFEHRIARLLFLWDNAGRHFDDGRRRRLTVDEGALEREIDESRRDAVFPDRNLTQEQGRPGSRLEHLECLAQASARLVDLVEKEDSRRPDFLEFAQDDLQRRNLARICFAYDDDRIANRKRVSHVVDEFDRAGTVEEGQPVAHIVDAGDVRLDAHRVTARLGAGIAYARALPHGPLPRQTAATGQYPLEEAGFSALKWPDDGDEARTGDAVLMIGCGQSRAPSSVSWRGAAGPHDLDARRTTRSRNESDAVLSCY